MCCHLSSTLDALVQLQSSHAWC